MTTSEVEETEAQEVKPKEKRRSGIGSLGQVNERTGPLSPREIELEMVDSKVDEWLGSHMLSVGLAIDPASVRGRLLRKQVEKLGSILMKPFWTAGAYQGGFKQYKRTTGRIFILLATLSAALSPQAGAESRGYACGLLLVDIEQFFDTLRQERLFHKMQTAGIPDYIIMLWKELVQTHSARSLLIQPVVNLLRFWLVSPKAQTCHIVC